MKCSTRSFVIMLFPNTSPGSAGSVGSCLFWEMSLCHRSGRKQQQQPQAVVQEGLGNLHHTSRMEDALQRRCWMLFAEGGIQATAPSLVLQIGREKPRTIWLCFGLFVCYWFCCCCCCCCCCYQGGVGGTEVSGGDYLTVHVSQD